MLALLGCAEEDAEVDEELGYPPIYAKLCRHEDSAGLPTPFAEGPPQRFLPYAPHAEDFQHLKDWDTLFPVVAEKERDSSNLRKHAEELWQQLDHLGNAGFDPSKFRVDPYGNVVYWNADSSSPLAWDIDHWFPSSRGGKKELPNLRIVQWQAFLRKRDRLEFLVPWWDLQHGCSINQFLSAFAAKNADFRRRSFASFFEGGENEAVAREHVGECRPWPQPFREQKVLCGLAAAAIVGASTPPLRLHTTSGAPRHLGSYSHTTDFITPSQRHRTAKEAEAVKTRVSKFGLEGSWNEINAPESTLANPSTAQIRNKFRVMRGASQNSSVSSVDTSHSDRPGRETIVTTALQKELRVKIVRDEARREREEELTQLEETVMKLKLENEKARRKALELESLLKKRKRSMEKHRKLAERHSSYRLCLERVLRDTMHQAMTYKEQAQLTKEACNVLVARLECQKAVCEAVESELLQRHSKRVTLKAAALAAAVDGIPSRKGASLKLLKAAVPVTRGQDLVDVSSCVSLHDNNNHDNDGTEENLFSALSDASEDEAVSAFPREHQRKSLVRHAIKEYMTHPRTRVRRSEETAHSVHLQYDADSEETPESSSDSDFADDELSPTIHISKDGTCNNGDDNQVVSEVSKLHDGLTSELQGFCTRNSTPCDRDLAALDTTPLPSADDASRSDSKREVQKDVISESTTKQPPSYESTETAATYKQAYMDELLQHIRFLIPTPESKGQTVQADVDEILLQQVLTTHLENLRSLEDERKQIPNPDTDSDEQAKQNGKSNLDKWLQALLVKDTDSTGSSPGRDDDSPLPTALSQSRVATMLDSLDRARQQELVGSSGANAEKPRSLRRALLRKLSVKHHRSELESSEFECNENHCGERQSS